MALIYAFKNRGITRDITIKDIDGNTITLTASDKIRAVIGHMNKLDTDFSTAEFSVDSDAATAAGSSFTKNHPSSGINRLRIDASDLNFDPGTYTILVDMFDDSDSQEWKNVDRFIFYLEGTE